jgi:hypothetical protein
LKKRELCVLISSLLAFTTEAGAQCRESGQSIASGWGFTLESAVEDAYSHACAGCYLAYGDTCSETYESSVQDGWVYNTARVSVDCCS